MHYKSRNIQLLFVEMSSFVVIFNLLLLWNVVCGSGLWNANYGSPYFNSYPFADGHSFNSNYGHGGGIVGGFSHANGQNHDFARGYNEGDRGEWSKLSYGGHKSKASGNAYSQSYEHDDGDHFGHNNGYNNGYDQNFYGREGYQAPGWEDYQSYH